MVEWTEVNIPKILRYPVIGQIVNSFSEKKLTKIWYKYALPKETDKSTFVDTSINNLSKGGCFCLSSLFQVKDLKKKAYQN